MFHGKRHPRELDATAVVQFLDHVGKNEKDPVSAMEQAHEALTFLYGDLLHLSVGEVRC